MGPKYNVATCVEELGSTKSYWRSKRHSKRAEVPTWPRAQAATSELLVAVKWRERPSIPSIYAQRLLMGPKYNVATCVEELGSTKSYWRSKRLSKRVEVPKTWPSSQIGAVGRCEVEGKAIHSFNVNVCLKAPHGSQIQCCNMRRRIGKHQIILEEQTSFKEGGSVKPGPGSRIGAGGVCEVEGKAIHSFNICPKAPHGSQIQCCNMRRRIGKHQIILEEQTSFKEGGSVSNLAQAAKSELLVAVKW